MKSLINTAQSASNVVLMFPPKVSLAGTSEVTRVNYLWAAMLDLNAAPRGTEEQDSMDYRISIDMVSEMRGILHAIDENGLPMFADYYEARDLVYECVCGPDLTSAEVAALEAKFAANTALVSAKTSALSEARARLKELEDLFAEIARLDALTVRAT